MKLKKIGHFLGMATDVTNRKLVLVSGAVLSLVVLLTFTDVIGRYIFNRPIKGSNDIGELMLVPMIFFALAYTQLVKGHVRVDLLYSRFSPRAQQVLEFIVFFLSAVIYGLICWNMAVRTWEISTSDVPGPMTGNLKIPILPFIILVALGSLLLCLQLLVDSFRSLLKNQDK